MGSDIKFTLKPESISWEEIHKVLWEAHAENRKKGRYMSLPALPGDKIREKIEGESGKMIVAMDGDKVVATAAITVRNAHLWCGEGSYGYFCFASVLPEYRGQGIYEALCIYREREALKMGLDRIMFDTHEHNKHILDINSRKGFLPVGYFRVCKKGNFHHDVKMVKWLNGSPFPKLYCYIRYQIIKGKTLIRLFLSILKSKIKG